MNADPNSINQALGITTAMLETRGFCEYAEAKYLEIAEIGTDGRDHYLVAEAASAWQALKTAALADGIHCIWFRLFAVLNAKQKSFNANLRLAHPFQRFLRFLHLPDLANITPDVPLIFPPSAALCWIRPSSKPRHLPGLLHTPTTMAFTCHSPKW